MTKRFKQWLCDKIWDHFKPNSPTDCVRIIPNIDLVLHYRGVYILVIPNTDFVAMSASDPVLAEQTYLRIYFSDPNMITKIVDLLTAACVQVEDERYQ